MSLKVLIVLSLVALGSAVPAPAPSPTVKGRIPAIDFKGSFGGSAGGSTGVSTGGSIGGLIKGVFGTIKGVANRAVGALNAIINFKIQALKDVFTLFFNMSLVLRVTLDNLVVGLGSFYARLMAFIIKFGVCIKGYPGDKGICTADWNSKWGIKGEGKTKAELLVIYKLNNAKKDFDGFVFQITKGRGINSMSGSRRTVLEQISILISVMLNLDSFSKTTVTDTFVSMTTIFGCIGNSQKRDSGKEIVQQIVPQCGKYFKQEGYTDVSYKITIIIQECDKSNDDKVNWNGGGNNETTPSSGGDTETTPSDTTDSTPSDTTGSTPSFEENTETSPSSGGSQTTPSGGESTTPSSGEGTTPSSGGDNTTPSSGEGTTPSSGGDNTTPSGGEGTTPSSGGDNTTPSGGEGTTPSSGGDDTTPSSGEGTTPSSGGDNTTPSGGEGTTPSSGGDNTTPSGGEGTTPSSGGDNTTPSGGEGTTPSSGGDNTTPSGGEGTTPSSGGDNTTPSGGEGTTPSSGGDTTPSGGEGTTPSSGGNTPTGPITSDNCGVVISGAIKVIPGVTKLYSNIISQLISIKIHAFVDIINLITKLAMAFGGIINLIISGLGSIFVRLVAVIFKIGCCVNGYGTDRSICTKEFNAQFGVTGEAKTVQDMIALYRVQNANNEISTMISKYTKGKGISATSGVVYYCLQEITKMGNVVSSGKITKEYYSSIFISVISIFGSITNSYTRGAGTVITEKLIPICGPYFVQQGFPDVRTETKTVVTRINVGNTDKVDWKLIQSGSNTKENQLITDIKDTFKGVKDNTKVNQVSINAVLNLEVPINFDGVMSFGVKVMQGLGVILDLFIKGLGSLLVRIVGCLIYYIVAILGASRNAKSFVSQKAYFASFDITVTGQVTTWAECSSAFKVTNFKQDLDGVLNDYTKNKGPGVNLNAVEKLFFQCGYDLGAVSAQGSSIKEGLLTEIFRIITTLLGGFANSFQANLGKKICDIFVLQCSTYLVQNNYPALTAQSATITKSISACNNVAVPWVTKTTVVTN